MNLCAKRFEEELPSLANCTAILDEGISGLTQLLKTSSSDDEESLTKSRGMLVQFSVAAKAGTDSMRSLRDVVIGLTGVSKDVNRASRRLAAAIDGIVQNLEKVEAFAIKAISLIDALLDRELE
jgi:hypothetical protein